VNEQIELLQELNQIVTIVRSIKSRLGWSKNEPVPASERTNPFQSLMIFNTYFHQNMLRNRLPFNDQSSELVNQSTFREIWHGY